MSRSTKEERRELFCESIKTVEQSVETLINLALEDGNGKNKDHIEILKYKIKDGLKGIQLGRNYDID